MSIAQWRLSPCFRRLPSFPSVLEKKAGCIVRQSNFFRTMVVEASKLEGLLYSVHMDCDGEIVESLAESLLCFGAKSCTVEDANKGTDIEQEIFSRGPTAWSSEPRQLWQQSRLTALFSSEEEVPSAIALASQSVGMASPPSYEVSEVGDQDWVQQVQSTFEPIKVSESLWITPHWCSPPDNGALSIKLDPGLAFGTGEHPTTRLCLRFLEESVEGGEKIMDYGCGSGILSIAGIKMGASIATGVDIDPLAIRSSSHNLTLNEIEPSRFKVYTVPNDGSPALTKAEWGSEFDIIVANILLNPLLELVEDIVALGRAGAWVGLSGVLVSQVERVRQAYAPYLDDISVCEEDGWACIRGRKK